MGGVSLRKHSLEVTHGDYRRESFHCEHSLQSLLEIEGENGPAPPSPSSSSSPSPPMGEVVCLKPVRRIGRQESPLSRDTVLPVREKDIQTTTSDPATSQPESKAPKGESKADGADTSKTLSTSIISQSNIGVLAMTTKSTPELTVSVTETKSGHGDKPLNAGSETTGWRSKPTEKVSVPGTAKNLQQQDSKHNAQMESKTSDKTEVKSTAQKPSSTEQPKSRKGAETGERGGGSGGNKKNDKNKVKGPAPPVPTHAAVRPKAEKVSNLRPAKEDKAHLEVLEESPSSSAPSPSGKLRPMSPGDKGSFVTQLTSVAKTVLGPMKGGSQEGSKGKDNSKSGEEKRGSGGGKSEASSGGGRRGAQTASAAGAAAVQMDKGNTWSSKHHS